ncbi:MAG TPA: response regulator [Anaerolinea sp.]|nr:response regulator [Anaerolinea sp.]
MANGRDRVLLVENDPVVADLIGRQALQAVGYQVVIVGDANTAISRAIQWVPDLILIDINLTGLSGKDLLVALKSQGLQTPVILLAQRGQESDIVQGFRLGASDYLLLPVREAEAISAVERVLKQVHERQERDRLAQQFQLTNQELQLRVRELTTIFSVGKAVTSTTDLSLLMDKILDAAVSVTQADLGWFLMRDDPAKPFSLVAEKNLPASLGLRIGQAWDDGISKLVAMSGEALTLHGEPLKRFKIFVLGQSAMIAPIRVLQKNQRAVIGLLAMMRRQPTAFAPSEQHLLEALADYASIGLVNANIIRSAEERARGLQAQAESARVGERVNGEVLQALKNEMSPPLETAAAALAKLGKDPTARWRPDQRQLLSSIQDQLDSLRHLADTAGPLPSTAGAKPAPANLTELIRQAVQHVQPQSRQAGLAISAELPADNVMVLAESPLAARALDGLLSGMLRCLPDGSQVVIRLERSADHQAHVALRGVGARLDAKEAEHIFDETDHPAPAAGHAGGLGVSLALARDLIARQGGKVWLENQPGKSLTFHFSLPLVR